MVSNSCPRPQFEAALGLPVPEAEFLVGHYRQQFDRSASLGVPAHITINYPFTPHFSRPYEARVQVANLLSTFPQFEFFLSEIRTFPTTLYLSPSPSQQIVDLIEAVADAFPDSPPYGGQFKDTVPHLTVAHVQEPLLSQVKLQFAAEAAPFLPIRVVAREVRLLDNTETQWKTRAIFPLRTPATVPLD